MEDESALRDTEVKEHTAPDPEHPAKPDSPTDITPLTWKYVLTRAAAEFQRDEATDVAAALTYFAVLSLFPGLLAVVSLLGVFGQGEATVDWILGFMGANAPVELTSLLEDPIRQLTSGEGSGLALVTGILGALWAASAYVGAFARAMNRVYEVREGRPFWKMRPMQLMVTLTIVLTVMTVMGAFLLSGELGRELGRSIGLGEQIATVASWLAWPLAVVAGVVILAVLYYFTPNVQQPKFRWISVGAVVALLGMGLAAAGFTFYVSNFASYNATYGTIGSVIVLLLGLWIMSNVMLFGAELDAELERGRQLQAGIVAEESIQLPPRDTRQIDKRRSKNAVLVTSGREIRESSGADDGTSTPGTPHSGTPHSGTPHSGTPDSGSPHSGSQDAPPAAARREPRDWYSDPATRRALALTDSAAVTPGRSPAEPPR